MSHTATLSNLQNLIVNVVEAVLVLEDWKYYYILSYS